MEPITKNNTEIVEIRVPCKPEYVRTARRTVVEFAESLDWPASDVAELEIAASEAITNVVRHAYINSDIVPPMRVKCSRANNRVTIEVIDKGRGFVIPACETLPMIDYDREGGYGLILIKALTDRVKYTSKPDVGTRIKMTKNGALPQTPAGALPLHPGRR